MTDHPLIPRDRCLEHIRVSTFQDEWLTRRLLFRALGALDLNELNYLVAACNDIKADLDDYRREHVENLTRERFDR